MPSINTEAERRVPVMSATAVRYITEVFVSSGRGHDAYFIVEYGSGSSTKFFLDQLREKNVPGTFITVERDPLWYREMTNIFPGGELIKHVWPFRDYLRYAKASSSSSWEIPAGFERLPRMQRAMASPRGIMRGLFQRQNFWFDAHYRLSQGPIDLDCVYVCEEFKDQFGESPHKYRYIRLPLEPIEEALRAGKKCHVVFMVDGGPRADIVKEIFSLLERYPGLTADILLLEAYRGYYQPILMSHPRGRFVGAEKNEMLDGTEYLKEPSVEERTSLFIQSMGVVSVKEALRRELWHYESPPNA